jgi:hypothetical protein
MSATLAAVLAISLPGKAIARPNCDVPIPPQACSEEEPQDPPPPIGSDKPPYGHLESYSYANGMVNLRGWARDVNGGPVTLWINIDGPFAGAFTAGLYHAGQGGHHGFDISVPGPSTAGEHRVQVALVNIPDGTQPEAPYSGLLSYPTYTVLPAAPTDLVLTPSITDGRRKITLSFADNSLAESGFSVTYDWMSRRINGDGHWVTTTEARTIHLGPSSGTGRYTHTIDNLEGNTFYKFYIRTKENGYVSAELIGGVSTP